MPEPLFGGAAESDHDFDRGTLTLVLSAKDGAGLVASQVLAQRELAVHDLTFPLLRAFRHLFAGQLDTILSRIRHAIHSVQSKHDSINMFNRIGYASQLLPMGYDL